MYKDFFGLNRSPFELSPDPFFLFPSEKSTDALASISYAIFGRKGFVVMTGEVGTGKTLMLRCLFGILRQQRIPFAYVIGPRLSTLDFLSYVTFDLGITVAEPTKGNLLRALYAFMLAQFEKGLTTVLVIDEAHQVSRSVLEEIRLLTNLETAEQKLVQILLVGQPELDKTLDSFEVRSLKQRIAVRCQLERLSAEETCHYIERRLRLAGANSGANTIFPVETIKAIYHYSLGIPRLINSICNQALIAAYAQQACVVSVEIVDEVASYFHLQSTPGPDQAETLSSQAEETEDFVSDTSWQAAPAVNEPAARAFDPNTGSDDVKTASSPPEQAPLPSKPETSDQLTPISSREDAYPSASTITVAEGSTVKTIGPGRATATSWENGGGAGVAAALRVAMQFPWSILESRGGAQSVPKTDVSSTLTDMHTEENLLSPRNGPQKNSHAESRKSFGADLEKRKITQNSMAVAAVIALVFVFVGCGIVWLWLGTAGNAAAKPSPVTAPPAAIVGGQMFAPAITQPPPNSNSVPETETAGHSVALAKDDPKASQPSGWKQDQSGTPAKQSLPNVTPDPSGSRDTR